MPIFKEQMTPKERMSAYFSGKEVDRLPCFVFLGDTSGPYFNVNVKDYYFSAEIMASTEIKSLREFGCDNSGITLGLRGVAEALGSKIEYPLNDINYLKEPVLKSYEMLDNLNIVNPYKDGRIPIMLEALDIMNKKVGNEVNIGFDMAGPLSVAAAIRGTEILMKDLIKNKDNVHKLLNFVTECNIGITRVVYNEFGVIPSIADPIASASLINEKLFKEFVKPYMKQYVDNLKMITGSSTSLHICGKTKALWEDIKEIGFGTFSVDNIEDIIEAKNYFQDTMCLVGNVDPVKILKYGSTEDVKREAAYCLENGFDSKNGFILAPGCQIPIGCPKENLHTFVDVVREFKR